MFSINRKRKTYLCLFTFPVFRNCRKKKKGNWSVLVVRSFTCLLLISFVLFSQFPFTFVNLSFQLPRNASNFVLRLPQTADWLARMSHNAMQTVVLSPSSAGARQVIVGAWMFMARKYLELNSVGNLTAARKVMLFVLFLSFFFFHMLRH